MISNIFERFVKQTPLTVMVRAIMERIFATEQLERLFEDTAERQYTRELLFSNVVGIMSLVVCGVYPSVSAAYKAFEKVVGVSKVSLYAKINGLEPNLSQALVRYSGEQLSSVVTEFTQAIKIVLPGYEVRIIDGNKIGGTEHRLKVLQPEVAGALPGQAIAVFDPQREMVVDVFPEEDAHAQERSLLPLVLATVKAGQVWIADRNFCTLSFLTGISTRGASFVIREHLGLKWTAVTPRVEVGQNESGTIFAQQVRLDSGIYVRRITIQLQQPTRHGDWQVTVLTNLPESEVTAIIVADLYLNRWQIEQMFQVITDIFNCELQTLGYPKAALFVFCLALMAFNILSTVKAALKDVHGVGKIESGLSNYYVVEEVQSTFRGMEIAIVADDWKPFALMSVVLLAEFLRDCASHVNLKRFSSSPRGAKQPTTKKKYDPKHPHVATFRLLTT
jgi:branched-subunit amino acid transport protein